ncbi:MAG: VCBS repeat-containing protein [Myxococcales bacterium]|nr:VCBS repeat-containing protein [Myxococcales bacterium]
MRLQLCATPRCDQGVTELLLRGSEYRVDSPLAPGTWFWRVGAAQEATWSRVWSFRIPPWADSSDAAPSYFVDYNGDGLDDIATIAPDWMGFSGEDEFTLLLQIEGGFLPLNFGLFQNGTQPSFMAAQCDYDGDGLSDPIISTVPPHGVARVGNAHVAMFRQGRFERVWAFRAGADLGVINFAAGDVNDDGYGDWVELESFAPFADLTPEGAPATLAFVLYGGPDGFQPEARAQIDLGPLTAFQRDIRYLSAGDFDGNGTIDLALQAGDTSGAPSVYVLSRAARSSQWGVRRLAAPIAGRNLHFSEVLRAHDYNYSLFTDVNGDRYDDIPVTASASRQPAVLMGGPGEPTVRWLEFPPGTTEQATFIERTRGCSPLGPQGLSPLYFWGRAGRWTLPLGASTRLLIARQDRAHVQYPFATEDGRELSVSYFYVDDFESMNDGVRWTLTLHDVSETLQGRLAPVMRLRMPMEVSIAGL